MRDVQRRTFIKGLGAAITLAPGISLKQATAAVAANPHLTKINKEFLITPAEAQAWHVVKDSKGGPTIAGSPSWKNYLEFAEAEFKKAGLQDTFKNSWKYQRWYTTEWPDDSKWGLTVDGKKIKVANYGANSGKTPDAGVTGKLVIYKEGMPAEALKGNIAIVIKPSAQTYIDNNRSFPGQKIQSGGVIRPGDYEYLSNADTFPDPRVPRAEGGPLSPYMNMGLGSAQQILEQAGAAGAVMVLGLTYDALAGSYTFGVPRLHQMPSLYIDKDTGIDLIEAAKTGKSATLRLSAETEKSETYQLFGYLPGKDYGTDKDEQILLITHTDGPSISQENGGLGILGMVKYFSKIPKAERPRTLLVFLDCRHYMPGAEGAFREQDYSVGHPEIYKKVIAAMGIEHLGQIQVGEGPNEPYHLTDKMELSSVWISNNQMLVDMAIKSVKDNKLKRCQVQCPDRAKGVNGEQQGSQSGLGGIARRLGVPGSSTMGTMTAYWSTKARIKYFNADHFVDQVATMSQICGGIMVAELDSMKSAPSERAARGAQEDSGGGTPAPAGGRRGRGTRGR